MNKVFFVIILFLSVDLVAQTNDSTIIENSQRILNPDTNALVIVTKNKIDTGIASYYAKRFEGRKCSNGSIFTHKQLTAAHKTLKFGTQLKVTNLKNDSTVIVTVTDRLPKKSKRSIDLTLKAAEQLNFVRSGLTKVTLEVIN